MTTVTGCRTACLFFSCNVFVFVTGSSVRNTDAFQVLQKVFLQVRERLHNSVTFLCFWSFWITRCLFVFDAEHVILPLQYNPWRHQQHLPTRQRQLLPVGGTKHTTTIHRISSLKTTPSSSNLPFPDCFLNLPVNSFAVFSDEVFWSFGVHCFQSELRSFQRVCCHQYSTQRKPVSTTVITNCAVVMSALVVYW